MIPAAIIATLLFCWWMLDHIARKEKARRITRNLELRRHRLRMQAEHDARRVRK